MSKLHALFVEQSIMEPYEMTCAAVGTKAWMLEMAKYVNETLAKHITIKAETRLHQGEIVHGHLHPQIR